jgi:hypothetical protein
MINFFSNSFKSIYLSYKQVNKKRLFFIAILITQYTILNAQTTQVQFGQNRVQYHSFDWQYYNSENFAIYFYPGGQEIGKFVWTTAEQKLKELDDQMDFHFRSKVDILVYNDITDLAQNNIGIGQDDYNIGGTAVLRDNKMFLHYDGNHKHLQRDLLKGLSELYVRQMMAGNNFKQKLQNSLFLNLPVWYRSGLAFYMGENWNTELDTKLKNYLQNTKKPDFNKLVAISPEFAGQSFWYMLSELYGKEVIPNILYLTRINHNINSGFVYATNTSLTGLMRDWKLFYGNRYVLDEKDRDSMQFASQVKLKKRNNTEVGDMKFSADGRYAAYAAFDGGFYKVFLLDLQTKKAKKIITGGFRSDQYPFDKSYPILTWTKTGSKLAIISEKRDKIRLLQYDVAKNQKVKNNIIKFQRIYGADFTNNPNLLIVSGQNKGQTDLYLYNTSNTNATQLNNDLYDDLNPVYVNWKGSNGILFSSNRVEDQLVLPFSDTVSPVKTLDLFYYDLDTRNNDIARVTETPFANEKGIGTYSENQFTFLSDENGLQNQYIGTLDSFFIKKDTVLTITENGIDVFDTVQEIKDVYKVKGVTHAITNYPKSIQSIGVNARTTNYFFGLKKKKSYIYTKPNLQEEEILAAKSFGLKPTAFRQFYKDENGRSTSTNTTEGRTPSAVSIIPKTNVYLEVTFDSLFKDNFKYTFESDYNTTLSTGSTNKEQPVKKDTAATNSTETISINTEQKEEDVPPPFVETTSNLNVEKTTGQKIRILPYRARFTSDYVVTQLDNSIMANYYQSYKGNLGAYNFPSLSAMINFGVSDLMEDHKIIGGFRIPFDFKGMEVYVKYINLKKRIDKSILYYRRSDKVQFSVTDGTGNVLPNAYYGKTRSNFFSTEFSYPIDVTKSLRWSVSYRNERLDISYTDKVSLLLKDVKENWISGHVEFVHDNTKDIQFNIPNGFKYKVYGDYFFNANDKKSHIFSLGFDARHYQKVFKNIIWANRLAGAWSFGPQKILYFLGGVDTWLNPKYDYDIPVASNQNYGLQAPVTNLRGLPQNTRNGNNYLLLNSELRVPLFSLLAKKPLKSAFLQDFQLIAFFDAGLAYNIANPFNKDNSLSKEVVNDPIRQPIVVTVNYYRNPFVFGTGAGVRTNILGYFVRVDAAWGHNGLEFAKKPMWHISLSKDF